jgi:hypothetical protein
MNRVAFKEVFMRAVTSFVVALILAAGSGASAQTNDPFIGTWRLNLEKSNFPGPPPVRSHVLSFESNADGSILGLFYDLDEQDNRKALARITYRYDGKDYQDHDVINNVPAPNSLSFTQIDRRTVDVTHKLNQGRSIFKERRSVSEDGRTMTFVLTATDLQGRTVSVVQVFDRL